MLYMLTCGVYICATSLCRVEDKPAALLWMVQELIPAGQPTLIFASTRHHVEFLHSLLAADGIEAACVYGAMDQVHCLSTNGVCNPL